MDPIFTDSEAHTLHELYPDRDAFFEYFYLLSDRVQEDEGETVAEGVRFLCETKQKPCRWGLGNLHKVGTERVHWYTNGAANDNTFNNYLPAEFASICDGCGPEFDTEFNTPVLAITAFLRKWATLSPKVRERLWRTWVTRD